MIYHTASSRLSFTNCLSARDAGSGQICRQPWTHCSAGGRYRVLANLKDLNVDRRTPENWFNGEALTAVPAFQLGNSPRWIPNVRFGVTKHADVAIMKNFRWGERVKLQFRGEFFNVTNTPQFGRANTTFGNPNLGTVTGTTNVGPRQTQLGLRFSF
jgi:hypothetical protein